MEHDCQFEEFLRQWQGSGSELARVLRRVWEEDPDFICGVLRGERLGIPPISPAAEDEARSRPIFERVILVEGLLDELARDLDPEFASLVKRHRKLGRDRLFFPDMRDMTAEFEEDCVVLSPAHRDLLQEALEDHDLAGRMCLTASQAHREERNAAWEQFEERYHRLIYYRIHAYPGTRDLDQHEKQDVMQDVLMEMMRAACKYDARMASLNVYVTVVINRVCYRSSRERMQESFPTLDPPDEEEGNAGPPLLADLEYQLEDLIELFEQTMTYREIDGASRRIYGHILTLKWNGWSARLIAGQINLNFNPSAPLNENSVNQRLNELKKWLQ